MSNSAAYNARFVWYSNSSTYHEFVIHKHIKKTQTKEFIKDTEKTKNRLERERLLQGF